MKTGSEGGGGGGGGGGGEYIHPGCPSAPGPNQPHRLVLVWGPRLPSTSWSQDVNLTWPTTISQRTVSLSVYFLLVCRFEELTVGDLQELHKGELS